MIAIHYNKTSFTNRWIEYCDSKKIEYVIVNIFDPDIIEQIREKGIQYLFLRLELYDHRLHLSSKSILCAIEELGVKTFPNYRSFWHYDDKLSQKYIFEALDIPHAKMSVYYDRKSAKQWLSHTKLPVVFKLRCGAGAKNVVLLKSIKEAKKFSRKMFGKGIKPVRSVFHDYKTNIKRHRAHRDWNAVVRRFPKTIINYLTANSRTTREKGYLLVQEFLPDNVFDTRVLIIGYRAFVYKRYVRTNDFRASGSGEKDFSQKNIDKRVISLAFESARKIGSQSMAFDIMFDQVNQPKIIEMSYAFGKAGSYKETGGYWDSSLEFHECTALPQDLILEDVMKVTVYNDQ